MKSLFDNLNNYIKIKLNSNAELNPLITQYNLILNNMSDIANNKDIKFNKEKIEFFLQDINDKVIDVLKNFIQIKLIVL